MRKAYVPATHERGMSRASFMAIGDLITEVLGKYVHTDRHGQTLVNMANVNLYHINELFVMPLTTQHLCSFMEISEAGPMPPTWFISHWWGTPFFDTLRMLALHAKNRNVGTEGAYWMCTFANNQHDLQELAAPDVLHTPFAKAIMSKTCVGTVALLDEGKATPFTRIWCILEDFVLFDFVTIVPAGECESEDGTFNERCAYVLLDGGHRLQCNGESDLLDPTRAWLPGRVSLQGARVDILRAEASVASDRDNILRLMRGREEEINAIMRKRFLPDALYSAANQIASVSGSSKEPEEVMGCGLVSHEEMVLCINGSGALADCAFYPEDRRGNRRCLEYLLTARCDPNALAADDKHSLENAFHHRNYTNVRLLLEARADPTMKKPCGTQVLERCHLPAELNQIPADILQALQSSGFVHGVKPSRRSRHSLAASQ